MKYERTAIRNGDSVSVTIPTDLAKYLGLKVGDRIEIQDETGKHGKYITIWKKTQNEEISEPEPHYTDVGGVKGE